MTKIRPLLILGCQRSGTTLLASMLGRHSEINMLFESVTKDVLKLTGKRYQGNKLCTWRQIRMDQTASKWGHLMNRLVNLDFGNSKKYHRLKPYPTSHLSVQDYLDNDALIILIRRDREAVVKSMSTRTPMSMAQADREFDAANEILDTLKPQALEVEFSELVNTPEAVMHRLCKELAIDFEASMMDGPKFNTIYPNQGFLKEKVSSKE